MLNKFDNKDDLFLNGKFKKGYFFITVSICLIWLLIVTFCTLFKVNLFNNDIFFIYYNALIIILLIAGMIIDEKIRKYPGLIVVIGSSIYCFTYITLCTMKNGFSNIIFPLLFLCFIGISIFIYKKIYPKVIVIKNANKIFNTVYLIVLLTISIILGMFYIL